MNSRSEVIAMQVWDNHARMNLPWGLYLWLIFMAGSVLLSAFFIKTHRPARVLLGGFLLSHAVIWGLGTLSLFPVLRGMDAWSHLLFWAPGWYLVVRDSAGHAVDQRYKIWSYVLAAVIAISFIFDLRDAVNLIRYYSF